MFQRTRLVKTITSKIRKSFGAHSYLTKEEYIICKWGIRNSLQTVTAKGRLPVAHQRQAWQLLHYYHCTRNCKCCFKAATFNGYFENEILKFQLEAGIGNLYKQVVMDVFQSERKNGSDGRRSIVEQIEEQEKYFRIPVSAL